MNIGQISPIAPEAAPSPETASKTNIHAQHWMEALLAIANHYRLAVSPQSVALAAQWSKQTDEHAKARELGRRLGLNVKFSPIDKATFSAWLLPMVIELDDGAIGVIRSIDSNGQAGIVWSGGGGLETPLSFNDILPQIAHVAYVRPAQGVADSRVDSYIKAYQPQWLKTLLLADMQPYVHVMVASFIANLMGLAGVLFSMQVYDRVVPAKSIPTLYVLFSGVLLAIAIDFAVRKMRSSVIDLVGKRADLRLSDRVMGHALRVRATDRPVSTGTFISQLRELEQVRDMLTTSTVSALSDLPYFVLFLVVFWMIAGPLVIIPIVAVILMLVPGLLAQNKLRQHAQTAMRESSLRNAMMVEAIQGLDDIKSLQAEDRFQQHWNHLNSVTGESNIATRKLTTTLTMWTQCVMQAVFAVTIFIGAPMVIAGDMTTGTLVGASILGSRMLAPMAQASGLLTRYQQAKIAANGLNELMKLRVDNPPDEKRIHLPAILGNITFSNAQYSYGQGGDNVLAISTLKITAGDKIAVLGRNGAGKSTLLKAVSGLLLPTKGNMLIDDIAVTHIDPMDVRRDIGFLSQNARLFHGTIRDNILMGAPHASQADIDEALAISGADLLVRGLKKGLDHMINEGGESLSGGQKQSLLLARTLIRKPNVVLLDEPTASLDETSEQRFISQFRTWSANKTVLITTHRMQILDLVNRVLVVDRGRVTVNDTKANVLDTLKNNPRKAREETTETVTNRQEGS